MRGRIFGYTAAEAVGHTFLSSSGARLRKRMTCSLDFDGGPIDHRDRQASKDGREVPISLTCHRSSTPRNVIGASKVARDITERIRAQEALKRAHDELEERVRARTAELSRNEPSQEMSERQRAEQERIQLLTRLASPGGRAQTNCARPPRSTRQQHDCAPFDAEMLKASPPDGLSSFRSNAGSARDTTRPGRRISCGELTPTGSKLGLREALRNHVRTGSHLRIPSNSTRANRQTSAVLRRPDDAVSARTGSAEQCRKARDARTMWMSWRRQLRASVAHH